MNDKATSAKEADAAKTKEFAVVKEFWLGDKRCAEGDKVPLTESQAKRLGDSVKLV